MPPLTPLTTDPVDDLLGAVPDGEQDLAVLYADKLTFGATAPLVERIRSLSPSAWLEQQLQPERIAEDPELEATLATFPTMHYRGPLQHEAALGEAGLKELQLATVLRAARSERHLLEVMTGFWHDHFNVGFLSARLIWFAMDHDRRIRTHALGSFRELLRATATSPAMMIYLNNDQSRWPNPNENYAREVMELHTVGVDGGYSEADVKQAALALTGWGTTSLDRRDTEFGFAFAPQWHYDEGPLQVMDWSVPAMGGPGAIAQGESLLDHLARHPSTARFLSAKLVRRFLGDDDHPELVDRLAAVYLANDTAIGPWLRALVASDEFLTSHGSKLRRPLEHLLFQLRVLQPTMLADGGHQSQMSAGVTRLLDQLGHPAFLWATPDGFPDDAAYWAASGSVLARWNGSLGLVDNGVKGIRFDVERSLYLRVSRGTVGEMVDGLTLLLLLRPLPPADREALVACAGGDADAPGRSVNDRAFRHLVALVLATHTANVR